MSRGGCMNLSGTASSVSRTNNTADQVRHFQIDFNSFMTPATRFRYEQGTIVEAQYSRCYDEFRGFHLESPPSPVSLHCFACDGFASRPRASDRANHR